MWSRLLNSCHKGADNAVIESKTKSIEVHKNDKKLGGSTGTKHDDEDPLWNQLLEEALFASQNEPVTARQLQQTILNPNINDFNTAVAVVVASRLFMSCGSSSNMCPSLLQEILEEALRSEEKEYGHTMAEATREDIIACQKRDPACETLLEVLLYYKGFAAMVCHRAARRRWRKVGQGGGSGSGGAAAALTRHVSLWLQSQASAAFGVDIHPGAEIGAGVLLDHATGVVIGETAVVGDGCTILHGVTLGGTGKEAGDRHPKVGDYVLIGAGTQILGNIKIGTSSKIGAGSVVLKPIPHGATAVGAPAKVIGWAKEKKPGSGADFALKSVIAIKSNASSSEDSVSSDTLPNSTSEHSNLSDRGSDSDNKETNDEKKNRCSSRVPSLCKSESVFRMFQSKQPTKGVSYNVLHKTMSEGNVTDDEIGEVFFSLARRRSCPGGICPHVFTDHFVSVAQKYTSLVQNHIEQIYADVLQKVKENQEDNKVGLILETTEDDEDSDD